MGYMSDIVALELAVVDLIKARALNAADFPMPELPHPRVTLGRLFPEVSDDREYQAHSPDDVADPARKLVRHSEVCPIKDPPIGGRVRVRSLFEYRYLPGQFLAGTTSQPK
jgi:hypothetical protein